MTSEPKIATSSSLEEFGVCPNCGARILLNSQNCPSCVAVFGERSVWAVGPLPPPAPVLDENSKRLEDLRQTARQLFTAGWACIGVSLIVPSLSSIAWPLKIVLHGTGVEAVSGFMLLGGLALLAAGHNIRSKLEDAETRSKTEDPSDNDRP